MINQSHPGSRRISSYGNRQLPSFAFSHKGMQASIHKITNKYQEKGACSLSHLSWHDIMKHSTVYLGLNHLLYNVMKVYNISV